MIRNIHQTKYSQLIPGINRDDEDVRFTHGERCISQFGDGLQFPQKLIADATNAQQRGRHTKLWSENLNKIAENSISESYKARDSKIQQWRDLLNREVDSLAAEIQKLGENDREIKTKKQYFSDLFRTSQMTFDFRSKIPGHEMNDETDNLLKQEASVIKKAINDMDQYSKDLVECERKLKSVRYAMMSEVEAKALSLNVNKRCQNPQPLLSHPYIPENHPVDQIYHPNSVEDWQKNLDNKIQMSIAGRQEASKLRCYADSSVKDNLSSCADAWYKTSKAIMESVQQDEHSVRNIKFLLKTMGENISSTRHRIASLQEDLIIQDRGKTLQLWRLQMMTYRPGPDHIRDEPVQKLDEELRNIERKNSFINENLNRNGALLQQLIGEKQNQTLELERLTKKLFIERENCLGLRRTVSVEGVPVGDYM